MPPGLDYTHSHMLDLKPFETISYAALRIISGLAFAFHGIQKVFGVMMPADRPPPEAWSQLWIGGLIELVGGLFIAIGFATRVSAFIASGTMAVAYIQFHWKFAFDEKFLPAGNGGELALIYCFLFLFITFKGAGAAAVDRMIFNDRA
jgi:putative oxidoreductase